MSEPSRTPTRSYRIDVHQHYSPLLARSSGAQGPAEGVPGVAGPWSPENHLSFLEQWGIQAAVLSFPPFGLLRQAEEARRQAARAVNDFNAQLIAQHGGRFGVFATVPLPDVEGAIVEARRALEELGLDGVGFITQYLGRYLGDPAFEPLYQELDRRSAIVYVHPAPVPGAPPVACAGTEPFEDWVLEFVFDTTRTITSLVYAGVPQRYPNIRWIFSHGGGTIPFLAFRLAELHAYTPRFNQALPEGPMPSLRRFYYETSQAFSVAQLEATRALASVDRLLFGTDYPPCTNLYSDQNRSLISLPPMELPSNGDPAPTFDTVFTANERIQVERTNALNLFPRLAARLGSTPSPLPFAGSTQRMSGTR